MEKKYIKFSDGNTLEATQVMLSVTPGQDGYENKLMIQMDTNSFEDQTQSILQKITGTGLSAVNVYSDEACENNIFNAGEYKIVESISAYIRTNGLLYTIQLSK